MSAKSVAIVTGGAGGLGEACARRLAKDYDVVVVDIDEKAAKAVADSIGGLALGCDIASEDSIREMVAAAAARGRLEAMVMCAGVIQDRAFAPEDFEQGHWDYVQAINTRGTWLTCREAGAIMAGHGRGSIVNIASVAGHRSWPTHSYAASKAAVISLSRSLATEWGRSGVRVNSVSPGFTLTPKLKELIKLRGWETDNVASQAALGRWVDPSEIADAVAFLASDSASAITGIDLPVDCGWLAGVNWLSFSGVPAAR